MSVRAIVWAFEQTCPSPAAKLVLIKLADHADDDGRCWPSQSRVAQDTGLSRETVCRQVTLLAQAGLIAIENRQKQQLSSVYTLVMKNHKPCDGRSQALVTRDHNPCDERSHEPSIEPSKKENPPVPPKGGRKPHSDEFEEWWSVYPRHVGKLAAAKKYEVARRGGASAEELLAGAKSYAAAKAGTEAQFIAQPVTWLNQGRWQDEPLVNGQAERPFAVQGPTEPPPRPADLWRTH